MAIYDSSSHYSKTKQNRFYLDLLVPRPVPSEKDDFVYTIESQYNHRPDLLAFDLYGDAKLWWVFAEFNPDELNDPIVDFTSGKTIVVPTRFS